MADSSILEVRDLTMRFSGFLALNRVSLSIRQGAIHALIGPNGAGKTTLFNVISKFLRPSSGAILYKGRDITNQDAATLARRGLCRSFQISAVFPSMTVLDNVRIALQRHTRHGAHFWRSGHCLDALNDRAHSLLDAVGLAAYGTQITSQLPYGRKRALELATTLALDPEVLLLDEPTSGLGREDIPTIASFIRQAATGRTVVMVEHNLPVVAELADRITVLQRGEVLAEGPYKEISADPAVMQAYLGAGDA